MFAFSIIIAIIIGYLFKGSLKNITDLNYRCPGLIISGFIIEFVMKVFLKNGALEIGALTYFINVIMYGLIMSFILLNRKDKFILTVGLGFLLNIIVIFTNDCTMPIGLKALKILNFNSEVNKMGLYALVDSNTSFVILADIIPYKLGLVAGIASIGDIFISIGIIGIIVKAMRKKPLIQNENLKIND